MYVSNQRPTELYYQRHELLLQETHDARLARRQSAARRKGSTEKSNERRTEAFLRRALASWGRTSIPFFRA